MPHRLTTFEREQLTSAVELLSALELLASFSLPKIDSTAGAATISMHPLIHIWAGDRMTPEERELAWQVAGSLVGLAAHGSETTEPFWRLLQPHIHLYLDNRFTNSMDQPVFLWLRFRTNAGDVLYLLRDDKLASVLSMLRKIKPECSLGRYDSLLLD